MFDLLLVIASIGSGAVASIVGFGIGSILTPLLALSVGTKAAVAAISIPHFIATVLRFWLVRAHVDRKVLLGFGITSALGGLTGALLHASFQSGLLTLVFGFLLVFAGAMAVTGLARKLRFHGKAGWAAGALSGVFGGLIGNQGGIRSAALMTFDLPKHALVATATATGVIVDLARMPVYLATDPSLFSENARVIALASLGVVFGTYVGMRVLNRIPEAVFRQVLGGLILLLGLYMLWKGAAYLAR